MRYLIILANHWWTTYTQVWKLKYTNSTTISCVRSVIMVSSSISLCYWNRGLTGERTVKRLRLSKALTVPDSTSVQEACRRMAARRVDALLLTDSNALLCGILTDKVWPWMSFSTLPSRGRKWQHILSLTGV